MKEILQSKLMIALIVFIMAVCFIACETNEEQKNVSEGSLTNEIIKQQ